jgi:acid phosphatase family membrane protein YuiD
MGLTTALGVLEGTNSHLFAISLVFSLIVSLGWVGCHCCV